MTMATQSAEAEVYRIDPDALAAHGRSLPLLLLHRRCATCWGTIVQDATGGMGIGVEEHLERIAHHCSHSADFVRPRLPVKEAIFRLLLEREDQTMTIDEIVAALQERWVAPASPHAPRPDVLRRLLAEETFYGIVRVAAPGGS